MPHESSPHAAGDGAVRARGAVLDVARRDRLEALIAEQWAASNVPGVNVAVLVAGEAPFTYAVGSADLAGQQPLTTDATTFIYSITKPLLAALVLRQVDAGRLALDDTLQTHLPALAERIATPFTVRQLLQHRAGLPDYGARPAYKAALRSDPTQPWDDAAFLEQTLPPGTAPDYPPGTGWNYSNIGYLLVRQLVEALYAAPFADVLQRELVGPLGLRRTRVVTTLADTQSLTPGFSSALNAAADDATLRDIRGRYAPGWVAHGVVASTALETAQLLAAITEPASGFLSPVALAAMTTPHVLPFEHPLFRQPAYGLGLMLDPQAAGGLLLGHGGGGPGYSLGALQARRAAGGHVTVAVAANADRGDIGLPLAHALLTRLTDNHSDAETHVHTQVQKQVQVQTQGEGADA